MQIFQVVIIGILLVFIILMVLTLIMMLFPKFVNKKSKQESKETVTLAKTAETETNPNTKPTTIDDYTLISVITAAIATYRGSTGENADINSFRVVAFHKIKKNNI